VYTGFTGFFSPNNTLFTPVITHFTAETIEATQVDYPWHRNPFGCMHAICLTSIAEYISAVAMMGAFQRMKGVRGIPVSLTTNFHSKCRGKARAVLHLDSSHKPIIRKGEGESTWQNHISIYDPKGVVCAEVTVLWKLQYKEGTAAAAAASSSSSKER
jgi:acyl-coenzyme A thioesterase PaaI-like protein